jgi:signal peptidase I
MAKEKTAAQPQRSVAREYLEALIIAALFLRFANTFVLQTFYIPSGSMEDTLLVGDHLFVNRFIYGPAPTAAERALLPLRPPRRGDIVVFRSPETPKLDLVKRTIGLPGDQIKLVDKRLFLNGKPVADSSFAVHKDPRLFTDNPFVSEQGRRRDNFGPFVVPPGGYFCMGDNRDNSYDSRFWGPVPSYMLKGRALFIYWSYGGETSDGEWQGFGAKLRDLGETALGFFTHTRWARSFRLIR